MIVVLLMLSITFVVVAFGARLGLLAERSARNDRDRQVAYQAAEAALGDAEVDIMNGGNRSGGFNARFSGQLFSPASTNAWPCGAANSPPVGGYSTTGLCLTGASAISLLNSGLFNVSRTAANRPYTEYGEMTGRSAELVTGAGLSSQPPRYVVEYVPYDLAGTNAAVRAFRVTAVGYGVNPLSTVALQAIIYKPQ